MLLDCDTCAVRDLQCDDCVVTVLLGGPPGSREDVPAPLALDDAERQALDVLADRGLVPRLRLVPTASPRSLEAARAEHEADRRRGAG